MAGDIDPLRVRAVLGRKEWMPVRQIPAVDHEGSPAWMWLLDRYDRTGRVLLTVSAWEDGHEWIHASMSAAHHGDLAGRVPTYEELKLLHRAVFGDGWAYHVFAPPAEHVNIHEFVLHLWGRVDGSRALPDFARYGGI